MMTQAEENRIIRECFDDMPEGAQIIRHNPAPGETEVHGSFPEYGGPEAKRISFSGPQSGEIRTYPIETRVHLATNTEVRAARDMERNRIILRSVKPL
jgi:hypothetical protein